MPDVLTVAAVTKADLVEEIWAEVARHHAGAGSMRLAAEAARISPVPIALPMVPTPLSLPELLALEGQAFVDAAYYTLLRRPADEPGAELLLQAMAAGHSKIVLLGRLRRSAEGRAAGQALPGLNRRFLMHRIYRVPALGAGLRVGAAVLRRLGISRALAGRTALPPVTLAQMQAYVTAVAGASDSRRDMVERRVAEQQMALDLAARRFSLLQGALEDATRKSTEAARALTRQVGTERSRITVMEDQLAGSSADLARRMAASEARAQSAEAAASRAQRALAAQEQRLSAVIETLRSEPALGRLAAVLEQAGDHSLDSFYVAFEDVFRGTREDIKQRQRIYLPMLASAAAGTTERPILDIGCGRGEFLDLMRDEALSARGVDANVTMAALCREIGLDVVADDAVSYLSRQEAGSLGAVSGLHVVEHLAFKTIVRLLDAALRALAPGGIAIFETPNPANVHVGSNSFYMDPTHLHPLPGRMMAMVAESRGFAEVSIVELHPMERRFSGGDPVLRAELDALFHGPQDYALIARKP